MLLDNNVPLKLRSRISGHAVKHVRELNWQELRNGDLVRQANEQFDFLITCDKNMRHQTSLKGLSLTVLVLQSKSTHLEQLESLLPDLLLKLLTKRAGNYVDVYSSSGSSSFSSPD